MTTEREDYQRCSTLSREQGFLTNFDEDQLVFFAKAIRQFCNANPEYSLYIGAGSNRHCDYGLYQARGGDLSRFWKLYRALKTPAKHLWK